jgi:hypothetical protein
MGAILLPNPDARKTHNFDKLAGFLAKAATYPAGKVMAVPKLFRRSGNRFLIARTVNASWVTRKGNKLGAYK